MYVKHHFRIKLKNYRNNTIVMKIKYVNFETFLFLKLRLRYMKVGL